MCERKWVFHTLMFIAGFFGAYTYVLRGHVFCNAQTGNALMMGLAVGAANWGKALYYLIPLAAYITGSLASELLPNPVKHHLPIRWDTLLIIIEMAAVFILGLIPLSAPVQIAQVAINFIASMQYNTFRQAEGIAMATTFATNHVRQIGIALAREIKHPHQKGSAHRQKLLQHTEMLLLFIAGASIGELCCGIFEEKAIWVTLIPFGVILAALLHADLVSEKDLMEKKPMGH